jgi:hypothetical protein
MAASMRCAPTLFACAAALFAGACDGDAKPVAGRDGRERWVVSFDGSRPELAEYRKLLKDDPAAVPAYVQKMRDRQAQAHPELDQSVAAIGGAVVERWWMSNKVTVEIPRSGLATIQAVPGVKSVEPDTLLAQQ